jgi:hypothetical protein
MRGEAVEVSGRFSLVTFDAPGVRIKEAERRRDGMQGVA